MTKIMLILSAMLLFGCDSDDGNNDTDNTNDSETGNGSGTDGTDNQEGDTYPEPDKIVALTFDDGPDVTKTNEVLDKLETYGAKASFFEIGQKMSESTKDTMLRIVSLGCDIQNHSWSYNAMDSMTAEEIEKSVNDTTAAIEEYAGISPSFFRPPNLATSDVMYETIPYPFASGLMANDWEASATPESISDTILNHVKDGTIILLHDHQPPTPHPTIEALDTILPTLRAEGYEIVTLPQLFEKKGVDPASKTTGMWTQVN